MEKSEVMVFEKERDGKKHGNGEKRIKDFKEIKYCTSLINNEDGCVSLHGPCNLHLEGRIYVFCNSFNNVSRPVVIYMCIY